ncbi:hypothetical protein Rcae01_06337 [Novipirellula caenicola]|uniref:Uncharacterized protein n=1 Tax=Novipirellula caenicola TaxID=1536901 RepID=A0ABP9W0C3_9BACT
MGYDIFLPNIGSIIASALGRRPAHLQRVCRTLGYVFARRLPLGSYARPSVDGGISTLAKAANRPERLLQTRVTGVYRKMGDRKMKKPQRLATTTEHSCFPIF